jgi:hypothetical protein
VPARLWGTGMACMHVPCTGTVLPPPGASLTRLLPVALLCREVEASKSAGQGRGEQEAKEANMERTGQASPAASPTAGAAAKPDGDEPAAAEDGKQAEQSKVSSQIVAFFCCLPCGRGRRHKRRRLR